MEIEPARTEAIIRDRTLWGGNAWLPLVRLAKDGEQRARLVHAHRLEREFFFVIQIRGGYDAPTEMYESLKEFLAAGWRAV